ncbi:hypothetical protein B0H13DRAFT_1916968 [Mycena leptocephala]|nr:hypothetical protein B0H13DRAFT_1916968 [Mycena leptocephala]
MGDAMLLQWCNVGQADIYHRVGDMVAARALLQKGFKTARGKHAEIVSSCLEKLGDPSYWNDSRCTSVKGKLEIHKACNFLGTTSSLRVMRIQQSTSSSLPWVDLLEWMFIVAEQSACSVLGHCKATWQLNEGSRALANSETTVEYIDERLAAIRDGNSRDECEMNSAQPTELNVLSGLEGASDTPSEIEDQRSWTWKSSSVVSFKGMFVGCLCKFVRSKLSEGNLVGSGRVLQKLCKFVASPDSASHLLGSRLSDALLILSSHHHLLRPPCAVLTNFATTATQQFGTSCSCNAIVRILRRFWSINLMDFGHQTPFLPLDLFPGASQPGYSNFWLPDGHPTRETSQAANYLAQWILDQTVGDSPQRLCLRVITASSEFNEWSHDYFIDPGAGASGPCVHHLA